MKFKKISLFIFAGLMSIGILAGCSSPAQESSSEVEHAENQNQELVIYSGRREPLIAPIIEKFKEETGIEVVTSFAGASELANVIMEEKNNPRGDIFIANDAGTLEKLALEGMLSSNDSSELQNVPSNFRSSEGYWTAVSLRSRLIMYNTDLVDESELPKSILDLADSKWEGQVAIPQTGNESIIGHVTALRNELGDESAENFLLGLKDNKVNVLKGHTDIRKAVGAGEFKLGLVNSYYYYLEKSEGSNVAAVALDQGADDMGAMVNISGVGIIQGAKNMEAAKLFVDFLLRDDIQKMFAEINFEMPAVEGIETSEGVMSLNDIKVMDMPLSILGIELNNTMNMLERVNLEM